MLQQLAYSGASQKSPIKVTPHQAINILSDLPLRGSPAVASLLCSVLPHKSANGNTLGLGAASVIAEIRWPIKGA